MSENQSMFPGEDGAPPTPVHPELPPGMAQFSAPWGCDVKDIPLYTPPERCQTRKLPQFPGPVMFKRYDDEPSGPIPSAGMDIHIDDPTADALRAHVAKTKWGPSMQPPLGLPTDAAERKRLQLWTFLMNYFPDAFLAVLDVSIKGNDQHNPGQDLHWAREKSKDQMNTAFRHMWDYGRGVRKDTDGCYHLAKAIWRLSAELQLNIEAAQAAGVDR